MKNNYINPNYTRLHRAVIANDIQEVRDILKVASPVYIMAESADSNHSTASDIAAKLERVDILQEIHDAYCYKVFAFIDTVCQQFEESLSHTMLQLDSWEPCSFVTHAFANHHGNVNPVGECHDDQTENCL